MMTLEEINARLREIGIEPNQEWGQNADTSVPNNVKQLLALGDVLKQAVELQIKEDVKTVAALKETLQRLRHGGGV